jgi:protein-arginine kinase activator protein McsA
MDITDLLEEAKRKKEQYVKEGKFEYAAIERDKIKKYEDCISKKGSAQH